MSPKNPINPISPISPISPINPKPEGEELLPAPSSPRLLAEGPRLGASLGGADPGRAAALRAAISAILEQKPSW